MIDKRRCSFPEKRQFFLDQFFIVIDPLCSVPTDIVPNAMQHIINGTIQYDKRMNPRHGRNIPCLPAVTRDAVQHEHIMFREPNPPEMQGYDLFSEGEVLVLEQEAALKNTVNEIELLLRIGNGPFRAGNSTS